MMGQDEAGCKAFQSEFKCKHIQKCLLLNCSVRMLNIAGILGRFLRNKDCLQVRLRFEKQWKCLETKGMLSLL